MISFLLHLRMSPYSYPYALVRSSLDRGEAVLLSTSVKRLFFSLGRSRGHCIWSCCVECSRADSFIQCFV